MFSSQIYAKNSYNKADSIILKVLENRDFYGKYIDEYEANVYIKGNSYVKKKNLLYRYAPDFLFLDKKGNSTFTEAIVNVRFNAPNYFNQQIIAVNGSKINSDDIRERVMQYLNVNIYNPTIFNDQILFPEVKTAFKYYRFEYISQTDTLNHTIHRIRAVPKIRSQQLISGYFYIVDGLWTIYRFDISGKWEFSKFRVETEFGLPEKEFLLPLKSRITFNLNLLGNEVTNYYFSSFSYNRVERHKPKTPTDEINYDLTDYFSGHIDSIPIIKDEQFWKENRSIALTPYEESLIETNRETQHKTDSTIYYLDNSWNFSKGILSTKRFKYNKTQMSYSGLLNPFKLAYSKLDGIVYWQQFRYKKPYENGQELQFNPNIGILFQRKQIYFNTPIEWLFQPKRFGKISFNFGNKNQTYNSATINMINEGIPDSILFSDLNLDYFHHYNMNFAGKYEIANGLLIRGEINYDWYVPIKHKNEQIADLREDTGKNIDEDVIDVVEDRYRAFAPMIGMTWTPKQFYRINGKRKEYVGSAYPTFSVEYTWGIKDIIKSNSNYTLIEADVQQKISTGLMSSFQYYIGVGKFVKANSLYFTDFNLFQKRNFPQSWGDPIGGVFHLLDGEWYNTSQSYTQAHFMYEFPCTFLRLFRGVAKDILKERIYLSQLYTPARPYYTELGYGIGNFIGNVGIFTSFHRGKHESVGIKFAFELGK
ncbi:hypothetical protein FACS189432_07980 [Bacteroidia bacterium]|nr:hypothetical protein FACS189426_09060 [Bacteroidia bacterium]GHT29119.1 hypothetical protein FACS189432_07980 [Bacteroidia bacterium]